MRRRVTSCVATISRRVPHVPRTRTTRFDARSPGTRKMSPCLWVRPSHLVTRRKRVPVIEKHDSARFGRGGCGETLADRAGEIPRPESTGGGGPTTDGTVPAQRAADADAWHLDDLTAVPATGRGGEGCAR